jgi:4-amino-4-deoxy-L-arabinose transferase-like glycosyltransferase
MTKNQKIQWIIALGALVLFIPLLGYIHLFDWDEINFAEAAREMIVTGNYSTVQIDFEPFWEKPPLFFWMQALSMKLFGVGEFAARFPNAICGLITLLSVYRVGIKLFNQKVGIWWTLLFAGSILPHFYFKSGIIDPWFNLFMFLGIVHAVYLIYKPESGKIGRKNAVLSGLFIGLAIMTKGPVALLIFILVFGVYLLLTRFKGSKASIKSLIFTAISMTAVGGLWFLIEFINGRGFIIRDFIVYQLRLLETQDAGHGGPFYYHFLVLLIGCFPASIFAIKTLFKKYGRETVQGVFIVWMKMLLWVVLILFSLVQTKIIHYSSMCYFPLTFLGALAISELVDSKKMHKALVATIVGVSLVFALTVIALPFIDWNKEWIISQGWVQDEFVVANLRANVTWIGWEPIIGILLLIAVTVFVLFFNKNKKKSILTLLGANVLVLNLIALVYLPKIEQYSQGAAIEFYKSKQNENCYITTVGFKSYADLFYANKQPSPYPSYNDQWLLDEEVDRTVYVVSKVSKQEKIDTHYHMLEFIYEKNGYTFYKRVR